MSSRPSESLALAERAYGLVQAKPSRANSLAEEALELARSHRDGEAIVAALHALGFARRALGDPRALTTMQAAAREGERRGYAKRAALARRNVALYLAYGGKTERAVREMDGACAALTGIDRARSEVFRIAVLHLAGRARVTSTESTKALAVLRRAGDKAWEARLRYNRGASLAELGDTTAARRDLERARDLYGELGAEAAVAEARNEIARIRLVEGDIVGCLTELDAIDAAELTEVAASWISLTRAKALIGLRLLPEARANLSRFVHMSVLAREADSIGKARFDAANLALLAGDPGTAASLASTARRSFAARGQSTFAAAAALVSLRATVRGNSLRRSMYRSGIAAATRLEASGWILDALRGHLLVARAASMTGARATAERELARARPLEHRGTVADRIELRHVESLLRLEGGNAPGAERALRAGLGLLEDYRGALGAVELRATASGIGTELSQLGLRIAVDSGNPTKILTWAERLRGNALRLPLVRPPADRQLRARQTELRRVAGQIRTAEANGKPARGLAARQVELEAAIRARTRHVRGGGGDATPTAPPREAARALGERVLVEYVELDGVLRAVTLAGGRARLHELGANEATTELDWLRFALGRLARGGNSPAQRAALLANANAAAAALDRLLVEPLLPVLGEAPLVVVPTGALHALPWGALPSLRGRPLVVAPSLSLWLDRADRPRSRRRKTALIAGPGLRHAAIEVRELVAAYPAATVLHGKAATAASTLTALDGAALAHIACHGRFRADSPLFSSLEVADGPLTVLDLQRLRRAPEVLVLSSCDLALSDRHPGDELLGLAAALLAMGTRTIVASVVPVPDAAARRLMLAFHRELGAGAPPATALTRAQAALRGRSAALAGFVCLGSG